MITCQRIFWRKVVADRYDPRPLAARVLEGSLPMELAIGGVERIIVQRTLETYHSDRARAAYALGITVEELAEKLGN